MRDVDVLSTWKIQGKSIYVSTAIIIIAKWCIVASRYTIHIFHKKNSSLRIKIKKISETIQNKFVIML